MIFRLLLIVFCGCSLRGLSCPNDLSNHVCLGDGSKKIVSVGEYLEMKNSIPLSEIFGLNKYLTQPDHSTFFSLLKKSAPHTQETIESSLKIFYNKTFQINNLIDLVPLAETAEQRLAAVIIELSIWDQAGEHAWDQIRSRVWAELKSSAWAQVGAETRFQFGKQVGVHIWYQIWYQIRDQFEVPVRTRIWDQVGELIWNQVGVHLKEKLDQELCKFEFLSANQEGKLNEVLQPAINYVFAIYQLGTLAMRQTMEYIEIKNDLANFISQNISLVEVNGILNGFKYNFPKSPAEHYLIETQLKLIKKFFTSAKRSIRVYSGYE